ncbi:DUF2526 family protein [Pantoea agglomerans]|jgi:hypothetical protein|nr:MULTISPECIES: DUF2526 family protein [Pantoea]MDQ0631600.1 hypothetical protein [Pantoea agglomerans]NYB28285.1 DUF2526 family protein [Pantoea agglomerans]UOV16717.1 YdcY family protein [Pantoea agglomerans]
MKHLDEVLKTVDEAIRNNVIHDMNVLLCELSDDHQLTREERFTQQQRLRVAVFKHSTEKDELAEQRRVWLTQGGIIC